MVNETKPGQRAAQRLESLSKQIAPTPTESSVVESEQVEDDGDQGPEMSPLPTVRRIVTGHDNNGKAIFVSDVKLDPRNPIVEDGSPPFGFIPGFTVVGRTKGTPLASVSEPWDELHGKKIHLVDPSGGVTCRVVDFAPASPDNDDDVNTMHRTSSIDFGVVLEGKIQLVLDDGVQTEMKKGDVVVQRGTNHEWKNISNENCRVLFVLVPSEAAKNETTGETLEPTPTPHLVDDDEE